MPIQVVCPSCQGKFAAPEKFTGKRAKCPLCKGVIQVIADVHSSVSEAAAVVAPTPAAVAVAAAVEVAPPPPPPLWTPPASVELDGGAVVDSPATKSADQTTDVAPPVEAKVETAASADPAPAAAEPTTSPPNGSGVPQPPAAPASSAEPPLAPESLDSAFIITGATPFARAHSEATGEKSWATRRSYSGQALLGALGVGAVLGATAMALAMGIWSWLNPSPSTAAASAANMKAPSIPGSGKKSAGSSAAVKRNNEIVQPAEWPEPVDEDSFGGNERRQPQRASRDAPPDEPKLSTAEQFELFGESLKQLAKECEELKWKPSNAEQLEKFQQLGSLIALAMSVHDDNRLPADAREKFAAIAKSVVDTLAETSWGRADELIDVSQLIAASLESREPGVFAYATVLSYYENAYRGQSAVLMELVGTEEKIFIPVKMKRQDLRERSRWLVLGYHESGRQELRETINGKENRIQAVLVQPAYLVPEPK